MVTISVMLFVELMIGRLQWTTLIPTVAIVVESVSLATALHALKHVRTSQAAMAWVIGLVMLPVPVLPLYWVFARHRFEGYREAIRVVGQRHQRSVAAVRRELSTGRNRRSTPLSTPLEQVADVLDTPICHGNRFRLLIDGAEFFEGVFAILQNARHYVYLAFYTIRDDEIGNRFADCLIACAKRGVVVRLLYDEVGSLRLGQSYVDRLVEAGVDVRAFNTRQGWVNRFQINFRNHRKLVVADGEVAIVGGLNVGDEYLGKPAWVKHWRDTAVLIRGSSARKIQAVFAGDYYWAARCDVEEARWDDRPGQGTSGQQASGQQTSTETEPRDMTVVCATGPADERPRATMMFAAAAMAARNRLWISTPYLVPDDGILVALSMARARGVDVRILIPSVADQWAVFLAGFYYERELANLDVPVYRYLNGVLHQKCVLVDDDLVLIGSTNLDNRSLHLNFELMVASDDVDLIRRTEQMLEMDFAGSERSNEVGKPLRPWFSRMGTAIARLFSPVL